MNTVVHWIRSNVFIVVFFALMVVAAISLPLVAASMNSGVRDEVDRRARMHTELTQIRRTTVTEPSPGAPGEQHTVVVNNDLLNQYERQVGLLRDDADQVRQAAIEFNRKDRGVLMDGVFPEAPREQRELVPEQFHRRVIQAYQQLLASIGAGTPPDPADVQEFIQREQGQFLASQVNKTNIDQLTDDERVSMQEHLTMRRLSRYAEKAAELRMYAGLENLAIPAFSGMPPWGEMFNWQWQYWIYEDILLALADANSESESLLDGPVKRVEYLTVRSGLPGGFSAGGSSGAGAGGGRAGFGGGAGGGGSTTPPATQGPTGAPPDFTAEAPTSFAQSFTGRVTNPLYDVVTVELQLVADASRLPEIFDALSRRNFITVLDVTLTPRNAFLDVDQGFVYGESSVASVNVLLETIWLREWTKEFMPEGTRAALNIPNPQPPAVPAE